MALQIAKNAQQKGFQVVFFDSESTTDHSFMKTIGLDLENILYIQAESIEFVLETVETLLSNSDGKILYEKSLVDNCIEELKKLGWECKEWRTCVYIYPPNDEPKIFKYEVLDV